MLYSLGPFDKCRPFRAEAAPSPSRPVSLQELLTQNDDGAPSASDFD